LSKRDVNTGMDSRFRGNDGSYFNFAFRTSHFALFFLLLSACRTTTYTDQTLKESIQQLALKEVQAPVSVAQVGTTLGVQYVVPNLRGELTAGDDWLNKKVQGLLMILMRVVVSVDKPPTFVVLSIVDEDDPNFGFLFTRYVEDVRKAWADALSRSQLTDRLLDEYVIGAKTMVIDPEDPDALLLLLMSLDASGSPAVKDFQTLLKEVTLPAFLAKVGANAIRRQIRENKELKKNLSLRQVQGSYTDEGRARFEFLLDLVTRDQAPLSPQFVETNVFPFAAAKIDEMFKSYKFHAFSSVKFVEKNTGRIFLVPRK
ncbi:MAG: hypothetical protein LHV69_09895, partial [Elusimicrobia bacterium]|nr:hypothetical protein [Candidatus Obscuribacterium magneticum]